MSDWIDYPTPYASVEDDEIVIRVPRVASRLLLPPRSNRDRSSSPTSPASAMRSCWSSMLPATCRPSSGHHHRIARARDEARNRPEISG
jgi:hypothetical protein